MAQSPVPGRDAVALWRTMMEFHVEVIEALGRALTTAHDLSVSEFDVLVNLPPGQSLRHRDIVDRVVLTRSAMTRLIDRLVKRGLVLREADSTDQRGVRIRLTEAGADLRRAAVATNSHVINERFAGLDATQAEDLAGLFATLRQCHALAASHAPAATAEERR